MSVVQYMQSILRDALMFCRPVSDQPVPGNLLGRHDLVGSAVGGRGDLAEQCGAQHKDHQLYDRQDNVCQFMLQFFYNASLRINIKFV
jgi:hypothetical protein